LGPCGGHVLESLQPQQCPQGRNRKGYRYRLNSTDQNRYRLKDKIMARIASIASLVIVGIIVADIVTNASKVASATQSFGGSILRPSINGLLGVSSPVSAG
jgi:uncharacterized membrane protein YvbJ